MQSLTMKLFVRCSMYQEWNLQAIINQKGLYNQVDKF